MILGFRTIHPITQKPTKFHEKILLGNKIHTIRQGFRWTLDRKIHFSTGVRTKKYVCFSVGKVKGISLIVLNPNIKSVSVSSNLINPDYHKLSDIEIELLAKNDGFDNVDDFWLWFDAPILGQIIHWTDFKYIF